MVAGMLEELEVVSVTTIYILNYSVCRPGAIITELEKWYRSEARLETHYLRNASHYPKTLFWITKVFQLLQNISELPKSGWNTLHLFLIIFWKWKSLSRVLFFATPMDYTVHGILQARILELGSLSLLQGIFPTQGLNLGLLHCRRILYQLSYQGSPRYSYRHICRQNGNILHIFVYKLFKLILSHVTSSCLLLPLLIGDG